MNGRHRRLAALERDHQQLPVARIHVAGRVPLQDRIAHETACALELLASLNRQRDRKGRKA